MGKQSQIPGNHYIMENNLIPPPTSRMSSPKLKVRSSHISHLLTNHSPLSINSKIFIFKTYIRPAIVTRAGLARRHSHDILSKSCCSWSKLEALRYTILSSKSQDWTGTCQTMPSAADHHHKS